MDALDREACYRALQTRDARFDGRFFTAVKTTGIYCRPICPARPPKLENCSFLPTAAACEAAGYRSCLRCRPEASPEHAVWRGASATVTRALALIADGALDGEGASAEALAERLGVGERHLRRLFLKHLGAAPQAVAQTRRVAFAKRLIETSALPLTEVAAASGFGSVRRFNDAFLKLYGRAPSAFRRERTGPAAEDNGGTMLYLPYRAPYDWPAMLDFLRIRAIDGVEVVEADGWRRSFVHGDAAGAIHVRHAPERSSLMVSVRTPDPRALAVAATRVRRLFDLDADVAVITAHLSRDPLLAPLIAARPGLRAPGGWEPFELAVRAVLGQQVTLAAARTLACRLVERCGAPLDPAQTGDGRLVRAFPTPATLAAADLSEMGMPASRARTLTALAEAARDDPRLLEPRGDLDAAVARLKTVPGVGEWTAQYVALRALREPDAFPASDVGLLRAVAPGEPRPTPEALITRAEPWRPWRAYAAQHLWAADPAMASPAARPLPRSRRRPDDPARPAAA